MQTALEPSGDVRDKNQVQAYSIAYFLFWSRGTDRNRLAHESSWYSIKGDPRIVSVPPDGPTGRNVQ